MIKAEVVKNTMTHKSYPEAMENAIDAFLVKAGVYVEGEVLKNIKRSGIIDTGRLRGSITYQTADKGSHPEYPATESDKISKPAEFFGLSGKDRIVDIGSGVEYAAYNEYGTYRMRARPYLRPALRRSRTPLTKAFRNLIGQGLRRGK